jgi:GNAT superfamily N-acetyltransferase
METARGFYFKRKDKQFYTRPIISSDKEFLQDGFKLLSLRSRFNRFLSFLKMLTEEQLEFYTEVDGYNHVAWGILEVTNGEKRPAGIGRIVRTKDDQEVAEVGLTIVDEYQQIGLGSLLLAILNVEGERVGVKRLRYHMTDSNFKMRKLLEPLEYVVKHTDQGVLEIETKVMSSFQDLPFIAKGKRIEETWKEVNIQMEASESNY